MMKKIVPILRIFDEAKAKEFYTDYLGFNVDWEHRFEADMPLYMQVSQDEIIIHLSEHHGDCTPGAALRIETEHLEELHERISMQKYKYARPGIQKTPWDSREMTITDPFGNRLVFVETAVES
ncbi:glyoxalase superfamily protein [Paenibacillus xylanexedens]|uniref:glyoxalase superfamily protein n=1 Tax=Paenibacillus xylanexedens TaxID=528191 RepID=UPI0011A8FFD3|nr:glyoxalase superfamily protein [Paenibacillus xylanexedens]